MPAPAIPRKVVVMGADAAAVGAEVVRRRAAGERVAGFVGIDRTEATVMAEEMLGGLDELVALAGDGESVLWTPPADSTPAAVQRTVAPQSGGPPAG